jgi:transposase
MTESGTEITEDTARRVHRTWECPGCGITHDRDENAGTNLARLPASQAEAQSGGKTAPVRHAAVKRVNHLGKVVA